MTSNILMNSANSYIMFMTIFAFFFFSAVLAAETPSHGFNFGSKKHTHLHFYFFDILHGPEATSTAIANATTINNRSSTLGVVTIADDPLAEGPELTSKLVGRMQGMYAFASLAESGMFVAFNLAFVGGKYNDSMLTMMGRNMLFRDVREPPIIGGSGY